MINSNKYSIYLTFALLLVAKSGFAGEYDGTWQLNDTSGKPFTAIFNKDGSASGTHGDAMKHGTWKEENGAAIIHWNTGWTTRIEKKGSQYVKSAYKPGASLSDTPTNTSAAVKEK